MAIDMLFFLIVAAAHWHAKKDHAQQAEAARRAAEHLRLAYHAAAEQPLAALHQRGRHLARPLLQRQAGIVRTAIPELAEQVLGEPGWPALAATLADAEAAGHDPAALLADAAERRELGTAESISDVLVWRLRRTAELPADATGSPDGRHALDQERLRTESSSPSPVEPSSPLSPPSRTARAAELGWAASGTLVAAGSAIWEIELMFSPALLGTVAVGFLVLASLAELTARAVRGQTSDPVGHTCLVAALALGAGAGVAYVAG
ncbi:hypothetical protein [Streptomyces sp. ISL-36]|uniref:hypothetical protein n=1 Tax=Streptomyces sp. ISL-36 TaxID=2819182 RepID=UPI0035A8D5E1